MKLPEDNKKSYIFTKKEETDILQFNSLNDYSLNYDNDSNELSILGINGTLNKFPDNYFYNEIIWDTKGKSLVSDLDTKINTGKKKFNVNTIEFLEKEINNIIKKMNINENDKRRLFLSNKSTMFFTYPNEHNIFIHISFVHSIVSTSVRISLGFLSCTKQIYSYFCMYSFAAAVEQEQRR